MHVSYVIASDLEAQGGHVQHVLGICRHASEYGVTINLICMGDGTASLHERFSIHYIPCPTGSSFKRVVHFSQKALELIDELPRPDLIYTRPFPLDYVLFNRHLVKRKLKYAYELNTLWAAELRSQGKPLKGLIYPFFEARSISHASALLPVTQEIADYAARIPGRPDACFVAGNGIEIPELPQLDKRTIRAKWELPINTKLIVMAGYTRPWHGHEKLLQALTLLPADTHIVLIGAESKDVISATKDRAKKLGIEARVHVLPWLTQLEVDEVVYSCDIGVSPLALEVKKMKEAQSLKVRHYLAMGIPVLVAGGESVELLNSGHTIHIHDNSAPSITAGLNALLSRNWDSHVLRAFAQEHLSWKSVAKRTFNFLSQTCAG